MIPGSILARFAWLVAATYYHFPCPPLVNHNACVRRGGERSHSYPGTTIGGTGSSTTPGALLTTVLSFHVKYLYIYFFAVALRPNAGHAPLILEVSISHTTTHHIR